MPVCEECLYLKVKNSPIEDAAVKDCIMVANNSLERKQVGDIFAWCMIQAAANAVQCPECKNYLHKIKDKLLNC